MSATNPTPAATEPVAGAPPWVAAIANDGSLDVDGLLERVVAVECAAGRRVHGLLMTYPAAREGCECDMVLRDVVSDRRYPVSQALGPGATGCRADTAGFADASAALRRVLADPRADVDLVVCNRFGSLESQGGGFAAELLELMAAGIPLLTVVSDRHREAWRHFTGGARLLPADLAAVRAWIAATLAAPG
jgi:hypothetical protein